MELDFAAKKFYKDAEDISALTKREGMDPENFVFRYAVAKYCATSKPVKIVFKGGWAVDEDI